MEQNKYHKLTQISEAPKEDGYYGIKLNGELNGLSQLFYTIYFKDGEY